MLRSTDKAARRRVAMALGCLGFLAFGAFLGRAVSGDTPPRIEAAPPQTLKVTPRLTAPAVEPSAFARTPSGAAAAAGTYLVALGGDAVLDQQRLGATIDRIASRGTRNALRAIYAGVAQGLVREFGLDGQPRPLVIMRSVPLAYRVESFGMDRAIVAIWDLGVVGSGASVDPQASWRTQTITLVWEDGTWKASDFRSVAGPVPALAGRDQPSAPADVFALVPSLSEYTRVAP